MVHPANFCFLLYVRIASCNQYNFQFDLDARLQLAINDTMCFPLFNKHQ